MQLPRQSAPRNQAEMGLFGLRDRAPLRILRRGASSMRVILSLPDEENVYQRMQVAEARATAGRLGMDLELLEVKGHAIEQVQTLAKAVHTEPPVKAVLVEPLSTHMFGSIASLIQTTAP